MGGLSGLLEEKDEEPGKAAQESSSSQASAKPLGMHTVEFDENKSKDFE